MQRRTRSGTSRTVGTCACCGKHKDGPSYDPCHFEIPGTSTWWGVGGLNYLTGAVDELADVKLDTQLQQAAAA